MQKGKSPFIHCIIVLGLFLCIPQDTNAKEAAQQWEVINPAGVVEMKFLKAAPRLTSLDGKTIVLRWNEKHNGNNFLNRIAELLKENVPTANVIKLYEMDKSTIKISGSIQESVRIAKVIKDVKADIVIAAQTD